MTVAPASTVKLVPSGIEPVAAASSVPAVTVVPPLYVLLPLRINHWPAPVMCGADIRIVPVPEVFEARYRLQQTAPVSETVRAAVRRC